MSKRNTGILIGVLVLLAAATAFAYFQLSVARSDVDDLESKVEKIDASSESASSKSSTEIDTIDARIKKVEDQLAAEESATKKAKSEFDPDKPFMEGDVSVNSMLKTIDLNAETANKNYDTIQDEVSRLKGLLEEEKQVAGD